jgi:spore germination cell wall hydrolase CwlJ-like protein
MSPFTKVLSTAFIIGFLLGLGFGCSSEEEKPKPVPPDTVVVAVEESQTEQDVQMMARAIYSESNQMTSFEYIGWVIKNRMASRDYPNSVTGVVLQDHQFSAFNNPGRKSKLLQMRYPEVKITEYRRAYRMAEYILAAPDSINPLPGVTHFYMSATLQREYGKSRPHWATGDPYYSHGQIRFYRDIHPPSQTIGRGR